MGSASFITLNSGFQDTILVNDNLNIVGHVTIGGSSFESKIASSLSGYDTSLTVNSKLSGCLQYDPEYMFPVARVLNLSGLSLFEIRGYNNGMEGLKPLIACDISGGYGYSTYTVLVDRMASSYIWNSDAIHLATGCLIYTNTADTDFINMSELQNLKNSSSNIQGQLDLKAPLNNPTFTGTVAGITKSMVGLSNVNNTSDLNKPISTAVQSQLDSKLYVSPTGQITCNTIMCNYDLKCGDLQANSIYGPVVNQITTQIASNINNLQYTKVYELVRYYGNVKFIKLGRLYLPNLGGCQAEIQLSGSYGWNINNATGVAQDQYKFPNFQATIYMQTSSSGSRRKIFPNTLSNLIPYTSSYDLCHSGYVIITSPNYLPRGFYLVPVPSDNTNYVDIWYESLPWTGPLLLKVTQITGGFTISTEVADAMPLDGYVKLDMFLNNLTTIYKNPYNV